MLSMAKALTATSNSGGDGSNVCDWKIARHGDNLNTSSVAINYA
jgi:hypothetical protein